MQRNACRMAMMLSILIGLLASSVPAQNTAKIREFLMLSGVYRPDPTARGPQRFGITRNDLFAVQKAVPSIRKVVAFRTMLHQAQYKDRYTSCALIGCTDKLAALGGIRLSKGRFLTATEVARAENVCVVGERLAAGLFPNRDPLGRNIRVDRQYFLIVGVSRSPRIELDSVAEVYSRLAASRGRRGDDC